jgi:hypothetical protein
MPAVYALQLFCGMGSHAAGLAAARAWLLGLAAVPLVRVASATLGFGLSQSVCSASLIKPSWATCGVGCLNAAEQCTRIMFVGCQPVGCQPELPSCVLQHIGCAPCCATERLSGAHAALVAHCVTLSD